MSGRYPISSFGRQRNPQAGSRRRRREASQPIAFSTNGSVVNQLSNIRARLQAGENPDVVEEEFSSDDDCDNGANGDDRVSGDPRGSMVDEGSAVSGGLRPERNFCNTFAEFTRGLVGRRDTSTPLDEAYRS